MNPYTGAYYHNTTSNNNDGGLVRASLFQAHYVFVTNHHASAAMHFSRAGISELSGVLIGGRHVGWICYRTHGTVFFS